MQALQLWRGGYQNKPHEECIEGVLLDVLTTCLSTTADFDFYEKCASIFERQQCSLFRNVVEKYGDILPREAVHSCDIYLTGQFVHVGKGQMNHDGTDACQLPLDSLHRYSIGTIQLDFGSLVTTRSGAIIDGLSILDYVNPEFEKNIPNLRVHRMEMDNFSSQRSVAYEEIDNTKQFLLKINYVCQISFHFNVLHQLAALLLNSREFPQCADAVFVDLDVCAQPCDDDNVAALLDTLFESRLPICRLSHFELTSSLPVSDAAGLVDYLLKAFMTNRTPANCVFRFTEQMSAVAKAPIPTYIYPQTMFTSNDEYILTWTRDDDSTFTIKYPIRPQFWNTVISTDSLVVHERATNNEAEGECGGWLDCRPRCCSFVVAIQPKKCPCRCTCMCATEKNRWKRQMA